MLILADAGVLLRGAAAIVFIILLFAAAAGAVWVARRRKLGGGRPSPAVASTTSTVRTSTGSTVSGNLPAGAQSSARFCLKVTNNGQDAVYTEAGYLPAASTCTAGVAS